VAPGKGDTLDVAVLDGLIDLRRNREEAPCVLAETWVRDAARPDAPICMEPLGVSGDTDVPPLIPGFCSRPLPAMRPVRVGEGHIRVELPPGPIGETGAITCIAGHVFRGVGCRTRRPDAPTSDFSARVNKPCEVLIHDLILHRGLFDGAQPMARVFSELSGPVVGHESLSHLEQLPMTVTVKQLGCGPDVSACSDVPKYTELLRWTFERLGWDGGDFDVYRARMLYPVVPSSVVLTVEMPEAN
jgi:hypothetical protein